MINPVAGVLLAGGQSRRMGGGDKCLRTLNGQPMLATIIERIEPQVSDLALNANGDPERFAAFDLPVVPDPIGGFAGPLVGVLAGLNWAAGREASGATHVVTVPTDAPFFPNDLVEKLIDALEGKPDRVVLAASNGRTHPVCGLWPTSLAADLDAALRDGTRKVLDWTDRHDTVVEEFDMVRVEGEEIDPFFNTNRPDDLTEAEALINRLSSM